MVSSLVNCVTFYQWKKTENNEHEIECASNLVEYNNV